MFSHSRIQCYKRCRREYLWKYKYGLIPTESTLAMATGTSFHEKVAQANISGTFDADSNAKTNAMVRAYKAEILPKLPKIVSVEKHWDMELGGFEIHGYIDAMCEDGTPVEYKTTSLNVLDAYSNKLAHDEQIKLYLLATGKNVIHYVIMQVPSIRQKKDESLEEFEERCLSWCLEDTELRMVMIHVFVPQEELDAFREELIGTMQEINDCHLFYGNPQNCARCQYSQICEQKYDPNADYIGFQRRDENG